MSTQIMARSREDIVYPECDGQPMADNTLQFQWIMTLEGGYDALFRDRPDVFVAGDLLWYPVEGDPSTRIAPDVLIVIGRPKGHRGSYLQWREEDIPPQVVFEVLSPGNRAAEMERKRRFYERFGVEEYYIYDPDRGRLSGWLRSGDELAPIPEVDGWVSPRLGTRFVLRGGQLSVIAPDGTPFATYVELARERDHATREHDRAVRERDHATRELDHATREHDRAVRERDHATREHDRAVRERDHAARERDHAAHERDEERARADRLAARLRALGHDPDQDYRG